MPIPAFSIAFDDDEPILVGSNDPDNEFEALETQMVSPDLKTPYMQQWSINTQWEFRTNWLLEIGYVGSKGSNLLQFVNQNQALDIAAIGGFLARPGVPGGGFTGNYYDLMNDRLRQPEAASSRLLRRRSRRLHHRAGTARTACSGWTKTRERTCSSRTASPGTTRCRRASRSGSRRATCSTSTTRSPRSIDYFSDEGTIPGAHDQTRPELNKGLSDFHRKHRLILSWAWDLPFRGNRFVEGWQIAGIGTFQSGRPFTVFDDDFSGVLFGDDESATGPRAGDDARGPDDVRVGDSTGSTTI